MSINRPYILGTGSFLPETRITNEDLLGMYHPHGPSGDPITPDWIERHFGIITRALDIEPKTVTKRSREDGGLYDGDYSVRASRVALEDAGVRADEVDVIVHVSCTPDETVCAGHFRFITTKLGLRRDVKLVAHNLGCAGLAPGIQSAFTYIKANGGDTTVLLVASNCPSGHMSREALGFYRDHPNPWGWASPAVFGDGAGAIVMRLNGHSGRGLVGTDYESNPNYPLVVYGGGGCVQHSCSSNLWNHLYLMDAKLVGKVFMPLMQRNYELLTENWDQTTDGDLGPFNPDKVSRWYFHQANAHMVRATAQVMGIPLEKVPINVDLYGNSSAASTLILLDEDRRAGRVKAEDLVVFMWIGAGNGAMNGYASVII